MFRKQASVVEEVLSDFEKHYETEKTRDARETHTKFVLAVDSLVKAADILDDVGLEVFADEIGMILSKVSWHVPTSDSATSDLTPEKMEKNLAEKGWVFNADDGEILEVVETSGDEAPELNDIDGTIEIEDSDESEADEKTEKQS